MSRGWAVGSRLGASPTLQSHLPVPSLAPWHHIVDLNRSIDKLSPSINTEPSNVFKMIEARHKMSCKRQGKIKDIKNQQNPTKFTTFYSRATRWRSCTRTRLGYVQHCKEKQQTLVLGDKAFLSSLLSLHQLFWDSHSLCAQDSWKIQKENAVQSPPSPFVSLTHSFWGNW